MLHVQRKMFTFGSHSMTCKTLSHIFTVLLLTVIYCTTIPLLAVVHTHDPVDGTGMAAVLSGGKETSTQENPRFCAVCFRLNTTQTISHQTYILPAVHPGYEVIVRSPESSSRFGRYIYFQGRAPPLHLV